MMLTKSIQDLIAKELSLPVNKVATVLNLLGEGNTVPFIARYRKEMTGSMDEVQIKDIQDRHAYLQQLGQRKEEVIRLIDEQGKLTEELQASIVAATKLQQVEDLYRPYKQKRRTKATIAKEKGLEPLAETILTLPEQGSLEDLAKPFLSEEHELHTVEEVLEQAGFIIAEVVADDPTTRQWIRDTTFHRGQIVTQVKKEEADEKRVFEMYYDYSEPIAKLVPHRTLAMNRGEKEDIIKVSIQVSEEIIESYLERNWIKKKETIAKQYLIEVFKDAYKRLIQPAVEREIRSSLSEVAEEQAIHIFSENLRGLLLQAPLKGKMVLGVDPAYRTGCKLAVVDEIGKLLEVDVIYPHAPKNKREEAKKKIVEKLKGYNVELIAIGNGTASRETEELIAEILEESKLPSAYIIVNEAGASVYSASDLARKEFPDLQVEERSAVSIARRIQDPLAELVKIDPKSVGVGQYQHDVTQKKLNESLTFVVETAVNKVGVNVNTASPALLQYVSGLSKTVAENVVKMREENGKFTDRKQLKKIPRLGAKTYEQAIGFLRIMEGKNPLDNTGIHPESYQATEQLLKELSIKVTDLGSPDVVRKLESISVKEMAETLEIGELTLQDILDALKRPGRDPREDLPKPLLKKGVMTLEQLSPGMELQGTIRNVVDFGAFVDVGVKQDGLVHISKLKKGFVKHPLDVVSLGDVVTVWVDSIDVPKQRLALTMLSPKE